MKGLTIELFADLVGVSKRTVTYWLNGEFFPRPAHVKKIEKELGCTIVEALPEIRKRFDDKK